MLMTNYTLVTENELKIIPNNSKCRAKIKV